MSLRFVYGRAGSGKSHYCLDEIVRSIRQGAFPPPLLIVPEQYSLQAERDLIGMLPGKALIGAEILSFKRLAYRIFNETGQKGGLRLNASGKSMLLALVIEEVKERLTIFRTAAGNGGFVRTITETFTEFRQYGVTPESLAFACSALDPGTFLSKKIEEIRLIYALYEEKIRGGFLDGDDELDELFDRLDDSDFFAGREVFIDGFNGFTVQEENILGKIMAKAANVTIAICSDSIAAIGEAAGVDIFEPARRTIFRLERIADRYQTGLLKPVPIRTAGRRFQASAALKHLEENLYSYPFAVYPDNAGEIRVRESIGPNGEVEYVAREIIALCRDKGMRYRDIFVAARNLESYEPLIRAVFERYGIPVFFDRKKEIGAHPLIRLVLGIISIRDENWTYEAVFHYLKTGLTGIPQDEIDLLENYVLAAGIKGKKWTATDSWDFTVKGFDPAAADAIRRKVAAPFLTFRANVSGRKTAAEICKGLFGFLCELGVPERLREMVDRFRAMGSHEDADRYSRVWNIIMEAFDLANAIFGKTQVTFELFGKIIANGFAECRIGLIPGVLDSVAAGSLERSRAGAVKAMFLLGVNDGIFPMPMTNEGILTDADREILRIHGVDLAKDSRGRMTDEHFLAYSALAAPSERLFLSYASSDGSGRALRPSQIIARIEQLIPNAVFQTVRKNNLAPAADMERISHPAPAFEFLLEGMRKKKRGETPGTIWEKMFRWYESDPVWRPRCEAAIRALLYDNGEKPIGRSLYGMLYERRPDMSVSRLEQFAGCPFSYFIKYGLKAEARKICGIEAADTGSMLHTIMDRFTVELTASGLTWQTATEEQRTVILDRIIEESVRPVDSLRLLHKNRVKILADDFRSSAAATLNAVAMHIRSGEFYPAGSEIVFDRAGEYPPVEVRTADRETVDLAGKIDRMDIFQTKDATYIRIIDYKSGKKEFKLSEIYFGLQLQLPIYLGAICDAVLARSSDPVLPVIPAGMFYMRLDSPMISGARKMNRTEVENEILKELRLKGLVLSDRTVIEAMDGAIAGASRIIPVTRKDSGEIGKNSSVADREQFALLRSYVFALAQRLIGEMKDGQIEIRPYRKAANEADNGMTPCRYCEFGSVCEKELSRDDFYRKIANMSDEDAWESMRKEGGSGL